MWAFLPPNMPAAFSRESSEEMTQSIMDASMRMPLPRELCSNGLNLYYFNSKKQGEIDFVVRINDSILPIEVKSGKDYHRHNALRNVMENEAYDFKKAVVLTNDNVRVVGKIVYLPVYMAAFIRNDELDTFIYKVDLTGLTSR